MSGSFCKREASPLWSLVFTEFSTLDHQQSSDEKLFWVPSVVIIQIVWKIRITVFDFKCRFPYAMQLCNVILLKPQATADSDFSSYVSGTITNMSIMMSIHRYSAADRMKFVVSKSEKQSFMTQEIPFPFDTQINIQLRNFQTFSSTFLAKREWIEHKIYFVPKEETFHFVALTALRRA